MKKYWVLIAASLFLLFSGCGQEASTEKPELILATCEGAGNLHEDKISEINEGDYPYTIQVVDYLEAANGDLSLAIENLNKALAAGDGPDLIDLSSFQIDIDLYASKGVFEDLYPYLDADKDLSRSDFVESVLSACEYDGKLVSMMSGFTVKTMFVTEDTLEGQSSWSVPDFYPYIGRIGVAFLESQEVLDTDTLLRQMCTTSFRSFVDYESKSVSFDSPIFVELLEQCAQVEPSDGEIVGRLASVSDFMTHQLREQVLGKPIKYIGFPTIDGTSSGSYLNNQTDYLAICSGSNQKELCWSFLRELLFEQYQVDTYVCPVTRAFPTNVHALEQLVAYSKERIYEEDGTEITMRAIGTLDCQPAQQDDIDQVLALIDSVESSQRVDIVMEEIIGEELSAFLSGDQTAETTAKVIQNRVEIYVNEIG